MPSPSVPSPDAARTGRTPDRRRRPAAATLALWAGVLALAVAALGRLEPLTAGGLGADVGIQFHLSGQVLQGAVPVVDFEHGWNALGWYYLGLFHLLAFGQATLWSFLWGTLAGPFLAGVLVLLLGRRHGLPAGWLLGLAAGTLLVSDVPNGKYALPVIWLLLLRPGGRLDGPRSALVARLLLAGVMVLTHIELALMLSLGTAVYDALGARGLAVRARVLRIGALALGGFAAFGAELAVYAGLGIAPGDLIRFLILERAGTASTATAYDISLLRPISLLGAAYPATVVLAFVPAIWRRLSDTTRLVGALHLGLGLIAIRKPDEGHLGAATALLVALLVLGAWDLRRPGRAFRLPARPTSLGMLAGLAGGVWLLGTVLAGFTAGSFLALPLLVALTALGAVAALRSELPGASAGAVVAAVTLTLVSAGSASLAEVRGPQDELQERVMAAALEPEVDRCLPEPRSAWVVAEPLGLYTFLELDNPTPYYLFWPGFAAENDEVVARLRAGEVPAVLQVGGWPASLPQAAPEIEATYDLCATVETPPLPEQGLPGQTVRIWVDRSAPSAG